MAQFIKFIKNIGENLLLTKSSNFANFRLKIVMKLDLKIYHALRGLLDLYVKHAILDPNIGLKTISVKVILSVQTVNLIQQTIFI